MKAKPVKKETTKKALPKSAPKKAVAKKAATKKTTPIIIKANVVFINLYAFFHPSEELNRLSMIC